MKTLTLFILLFTSSFALAKMDCSLDLALPTQAKLRPLYEWERTHRYEDLSDAVSETYKVEIAEYIWVDNPEVQAILDQVHAMGGQVRHVRRMTIANDDSQPPEFAPESSYFWVSLGGKKKKTSDFIPVIATDLTQPFALARLAHEFDHFKLWKQEYDKLAAIGLDHETICRLIDNEIETADYRWRSEKSAVEAEIEVETKYADHPYMRTNGIIIPKNYFDYFYVNRMSYPNLEAVRVEIVKSHPDNQAAFPYMSEMVRFAAQTQARVLELPAAMIDSRWHEASIYDLLVRPYDIERLYTPKIRKRFQALLLKACEEQRISNCIKAEDIE